MMATLDDEAEDIRADDEVLQIGRPEEFGNEDFEASMREADGIKIPTDEDTQIPVGVEVAMDVDGDFDVEQMDVDGDFVVEPVDVPGDFDVELMDVDGVCVVEPMDVDGDSVGEPMDVDGDSVGEPMDVDGEFVVELMDVDWPNPFN